MEDFTFLLVGFLILIGFLGSILFKKSKIPEALFLIIAGILIGPVFHIVDQSAVIIYAPIIMALMLILAMLDNGLSFNIFKVAKALPLMIIFGAGIVALTSIILTVILHYMLALPWIVSAIIALCMSGTTTDVITAIISKMHFSQKGKQLLVFDSVVNDIQIIPFFILLGFSSSASLDPLETALILFHIPLEIIMGAAAAIWWVYIIGKFLGKNPLNYIATLGLLFIIYNMAKMMGGSGVIAVLTFSLILGNAMNLFKKFKIKDGLRKKFNIRIIRTLREIEVDVSFFVKTFFFVFLGIVFSLNMLQASIVILSFILIVAILICRYICVKLLSLKTKAYKSSIGPLVWICPRGYIAAILAFTAVNSGLFGQEIFNIVLLNIFLTTFMAIIYSIYYEKRRS